MGWKWKAGTAYERANMVRRHDNLSDDALIKLFKLTPEGLDKIRNGDQWRPEYSTEEDVQR